MSNVSVLVAISRVERIGAGQQRLELKDGEGGVGDFWIPASYC